MTYDPREAVRVIDEQISVMTGIVAEIDATIEALKELKERGAALVPISGSVFVPAKAEGDKVLVAVGGNVMLEKTYDEAIEILQNRKANVLQALERLRQNRQKILAQMR
jgi:prefoldin alpha subunit